MSAIFGIIDLLGRPLNREWVKSMQEDLAHRGPDRQGLYEENSVCLGSMILQVTPESVFDMSPYEEDGLIIVSNSRLDEREILMEKLSIGVNVREKITDPELLLLSYKKWGKYFEKEIYGDFTFAIWNKLTKELFCCRDHIGVKPFFYYVSNEYFVFSSEIKAIARLPIVMTIIDQEFIKNKALWISNYKNKTAWTNILRLLPATLLVTKGVEIQLEQYWSPVHKKNKKLKNEDVCVQELKEVLFRIIKDHTRVIGRVGTPLSGGLDSSTIACITAAMLRNDGKSLYTVSSILNPEFPSDDVEDEKEYIDEVLKQVDNIKPQYVFHTELSFVEKLESTIDKHYAPFNFLYYVDEALYLKFRDQGVKRVLSGYLGDLTASNSSISPLTHLFCSLRMFSYFKLFFRLKDNLKLRFTKLIWSLSFRPLLPSSFLKIKYSILNYKPFYHPDKLPIDLSPTKINNIYSRNFKIYNNYSLNLVDHILPTDTDLFDGDWDCGSSHHQIEMTFPFVDRRLIEFLLQIPVEHFYSGGNFRGLIRNAMDGILPEKIKQRKSKGPYSPGLWRIIKKDLPKLEEVINIKPYPNRLNNILNIEKLNKSLLNMVDPKKINTFTVSQMEFLITYLIDQIFFNQNKRFK